VRKKETGRESEMFCSCSISDNAPQEEGYTIEVAKPANITEVGGGSFIGDAVHKHEDTYRMQRNDTCLSCTACANRRYPTAQHQPPKWPLQI